MKIWPFFGHMDPIKSSERVCPPPIKQKISVVKLKSFVFSGILSAGTREDLLIQALKNLRKNHIDQKARKQIAKFLENSSKEEIKRNMKFIPAWIRALIFEIMELKL